MYVFIWVIVEFRGKAATHGRGSCHCRKRVSLQTEQKVNNLYLFVYYLPSNEQRRW